MIDYDVSHIIIEVNSLCTIKMITKNLDVPWCFEVIVIDILQWCDLANFHII